MSRARNIISALELGLLFRGKWNPLYLSSLAIFLKPLHVVVPQKRPQHVVSRWCPTERKVDNNVKMAKVEYLVTAALLRASAYTRATRVSNHTRTLRSSAILSRRDQHPVTLLRPNWAKWNLGNTSHAGGSNSTAVGRNRCVFPASFWLSSRCFPSHACMIPLIVQYPICATAVCTPSTSWTLALTRHRLRIPR